MPRTRTLLLILGTVVLFALGTLAVDQTRSDRPPGLGDAQWVPLSERSGLVITELPLQEPVVGRLWVKVGGRWRPALIQSPSAATQAR
jgi:hypothetical protein